MENLLEELTGCIREKRMVWVSTVNPEIVLAAQTDAQLRTTIQSADFVLPDGIALLWAGRTLGAPITERITGIDLGEKLIESAAENGYGVYFLGGAPDVAEKASRRFKERYPTLRVSGTQHGYFTSGEEVQVVERVRQASPDILFVGMGYPLQERFLSQNVSALRIPLSLTVGGAMDVWSGNLRRAPDVFIRLGMEWIFRLLQQPRRIRRQLKLLQFIFLVIRRKFSL